MSGIDMWRRYLPGLVVGVFVIALGAQSALPEASEREAYFATIFAVHGKPQLREGAGALSPLTLMQSLSPGASLLLGSRDSLRICYERTGVLYRFKGPGTIDIVETGPQTAEDAAPRLDIVGTCEASESADIPGGVLLRSLMPKEGAR